MRKPTLLLAACAALLLFACDSKQMKSYTFAYDYSAQIADEDDSNALLAYFKESFLNEEHIETLHATSVDAHALAHQRWEEALAAIDGEFILSLINDPEDYVYFYCILVDGDMTETVDFTHWDYELKEQLGLIE